MRIVFTILLALFASAAATAQSNSARARQPSAPAAPGEMRSARHRSRGMARMAVTDAGLDRVSMVGGGSVYPSVQNAMLAMAAGPYFVARSAFDAFVAQVVEILSWVLPPLHEFASADWLIRAEVDANLLLQLMQACVYMVFLAAVTLVELYRKQL